MFNGFNNNKKVEYDSEEELSESFSGEEINIKNNSIYGYYSKSETPVTEDILEKWENEKKILTSKLLFYKLESEIISKTSELYKNVDPSIYRSTLFYRDINKSFVSKNELEYIIKNSDNNYNYLIRLSLFGNILFSSYISLFAFAYIKWTL